MIGKLVKKFKEFKSMRRFFFKIQNIFRTKGIHKMILKLLTIPVIFLSINKIYFRWKNMHWHLQTSN